MFRLPRKTDRKILLDLCQNIADVGHGDLAAEETKIPIAEIKHLARKVPIDWQG